MILVAYLAPWMAPWATPGTSGTAIMSPTTKTFGWPLTVRSGSTTTRPARSTSVPSHCSASILPSGLAATPAAHTLQAHSTRRSSPVSLSLTVMPM